MDGKVPHEDYLAALALRKTIVFLLYSVLVPLFLLPVFLHPRFKSLPEEWRNLAALILLIAALLLLLAMAIKGILPGSGATLVQAFNEKQIGVGMAILSGATWLVAGNSLAGEIIQWVINGGLFLSVAVYFVTKSVLSRRLRWGVLGVLLLPGIQLYSKLVNFL